MEDLSDFSRGQHWRITKQTGQAEVAQGDHLQQGPWYCQPVGGFAIQVTGNRCDLLPSIAVRVSVVQLKTAAFVSTFRPQ